MTGSFSMTRIGKARRVMTGCDCILHGCDIREAVKLGTDNVVT